MSRINVYVGSDTQREGKGIYRMVLDTLKGTLSEPALYYPKTRSTAICYDHYELALIHASQAQSGLTLLDTHQPSPYHLDTLMNERFPACFVTMDRQFIYTVNHNEDTLMIYRKAHGKLSVEKCIHLGQGAKCCHVLLVHGYLYVICFKGDCLKIFDPKHEFALVKELAVPKGSGPIRAITDAKQQFLYLLTQSNEIFVYRIGAHFLFRCQQIVSILPKGSKRECRGTAIRISPNGKYLYTSASGADIITCFEIINGNLRQKEVMQSAGKHPRDFIIDETGRWMIVVNRDSDHAVVFQLDPDRGEAIMITDEKKVPEGTSVVFGYRI